VRSLHKQLVTLFAATQPEFVLPSDYEGPGDVVASASHWFGLRAYDNASVGGSIIQLRRDNDDDLENFQSLADGTLDVASIATWLGANNAFVHTLYDQVGADHLIQATEANQPAFSLTGGPNSLPTMSFVTASNQFLKSAGSVAVAQPLTWAVVARNSTNDVVNHLIVTGDGVNLEVYFSSTDNNTGMYAGSAGVLHSGATQGNYHSIIMVANGASSVIVNNGSASGALSPGTNGQGGALNMGNYDPNVLPLSGNIQEAGIWPVAFDATQYANMNTNQATFWGY
jgi:hypothetical protein